MNVFVCMTNLGDFGIQFIDVNHDTLMTNASDKSILVNWL